MSFIFNKLILEILKGKIFQIFFIFSLIYFYYNCNEYFKQNILIFIFIAISMVTSYHDLKILILICNNQGYISSPTTNIVYREPFQYLTW